MDVVRAIENQATDEKDKPHDDVIIVDCGIIPVDTPFDVSRDAAIEWIEMALPSGYRQNGINM